MFIVNAVIVSELLVSAERIALFFFDGVNCVVRTGKNGILLAHMYKKEKKVKVGMRNNTFGTRGCVGVATIVVVETYVEMPFFL